MRKLWLVIKHDILATVRQRSFWLLTLIMPVLLIGMNAYSFTQGDEPEQDGLLPDLGSEAADQGPIGLVDKAGLVAQVPAELQAMIKRYDDRQAAGAALAAGEIGQYAYVPADYLATGRVEVYAQEANVLEGQSMGGVADAIVQYLLAYNLTGDPAVALALNNPTPGNLAERHVLAPAGGEADTRALAELVAQIVPLMYYFLLVMGSNYLMRSVVAEKENRTVEMLLLSVEPRQMMVGKILASSVVTLIQVVAWLGTGVFTLSRGAQALNVGSYTFPPGFVVWAILFLMVGYLLFASVMAAAGAMANSAREGGQMTFLLILPLMPTLMFAQTFLEEPNGALSVGLSLFPFSAPSAMVTRMAVAQVPLWQILASLAGLAVTTYLFVALAARFFRAGNLLSSQQFHWRRLLTGWRQS